MAFAEFGDLPMIVVASLAYVGIDSHQRQNAPKPTSPPGMVAVRSPVSAGDNPRRIDFTHTKNNSHRL